MKIIIALIVLVPTLVCADVKIHTNNFNAVTNSSGEHFWTRLYEWGAWSKTSEQSQVKITPNYVKKAYDLGMKRVKSKRLSFDNFVEVFNGDEDEAEALTEFYLDRQEVSRDKLGSYRGLVTQVKISVPLSSKVNISKISLNEMSKRIIKADGPHVYKKVSSKFVTSFLDPVHSSHADTKGPGNLYLSMVNMGREYYDCSRMNKNLAEKAERQGIASYDGDYRMYLINRIKEVDKKNISALSSVIDAGAKRVFEQKILYASNLLRSGVNYYALYSTKNGPRLVMTSVLVATSQLKSYTNLYLNGFSAGAAISTVVGKNKKFKNGIAVISEKDVDIKSSLGSCDEGLGQGIAEYAYGLAKKVAN